MKKILAIALVCILAMTIMPVASASITLGTPQEADAGYVVWASDETEPVPGPLPVEAFKLATGLVLRVTNAPVNDISFMFGSPANWWAQQDFAAEDVYNEETGLITLRFSEHPGWPAFRDDPSDAAKLIVAYWDGFAELGMTSAWLTGVVINDEGEVVKAGVTVFIGLATAAVAISGGGIFLIAKKLKKK
ncbi:MAG: hypothetical protein LBC71_00220 [Oscillospiraceae bacterium]|jgi:hypothetical protein|nr:hypothetical protein [Oscillospiraceae bacterium]